MILRMVICLMRKRRKNKNKSTGVGITMFMVFVICGLVLVQRHNLEREQVIASSRVEVLEEAIKEQEELSEDLEEQETYIQTRKFIEEMARDKFGLVYEDEYMFKATEE